MRRLFPAFLLTGLSACAPMQNTRPATPQPPTTLPFQADFSDAGVTWVAAGKAYVARAPSFKTLLSPLPTPAYAAAWVGNVAWGALPGPGLIVTLDGPPDSRVVGRAIRLSSALIYRQDGTTLTYGLGQGPNLPAAPSAVLTGGDGREYALVGGSLYQPGSPATLLSQNAQAYLYSLPGRGVATSNRPSVQTGAGLYQLTGSALERQDGNGQTVTSVPHGSGLIGEVGGRIVTLSAGGQIRVFLPDLREVRP